MQIFISKFKDEKIKEIEKESSKLKKEKKKKKKKKKIGKKNVKQRGKNSCFCSETYHSSTRSIFSKSSFGSIKSPNEQNLLIFRFYF